VYRTLSEKGKDNSHFLEAAFLQNLVRRRATVPVHPCVLLMQTAGRAYLRCS